MVEIEGFPINLKNLHPLLEDFDLQTQYVPSENTKMAQLEKFLKKIKKIFPKFPISQKLKKIL